MMRIPQTASMSSLNTKQADILEQMAKGPILLLSRSTPVGVLVSVDEWNTMVEQVDQLNSTKKSNGKKGKAE